MKKFFKKSLDIAAGLVYYVFVRLREKGNKMFTAIITRNGKTTTREFADGASAWAWANKCAWGGATVRVVRFFGTQWERDV